jgi:hypothetical protein
VAGALYIRKALADKASRHGAAAERLGGFVRSLGTACKGRADMVNTVSIEPQIPHPDTINPQSPPETPAAPSPSEAPVREPPEVSPTSPDIDEPGRGPDELPETGDSTDTSPDDLSLSDPGSPIIGDGGVLQSNLDQPLSGSVE